MKTPAVLLSLILCCHAIAENNLVPNPDFSDPKNPLQGWRTYFPWEDEWYADNGKYVKPTTELGRTCVMLDLPATIAFNQGGKIESTFMKVEPGATYHAEVDSVPCGLIVKAFVEVWTTDPKPGVKIDKWRVPAAPDHPALLTCYRAQLPDPKGGPEQWLTARRDFTVPKTVIIMGNPQNPQYMTMKVVAVSPVVKDGKCYVTNFRLTRVK